MKESKTLMISIIAAVSYLAMVVVNALANILPIGGMNTGAVSDSYPNLFAPSGLTFSIWGVIYLLLALYCFYQFTNPNKKIALYFSASSLANLLWIFSWHYHKIGISILLMMVILICLIKINLILQGTTFRGFSYVALHVPFSVYFGWITVATIANVTTFLVAIGWNGWGISQALWTALILVVGVLIALSWALKHKDIPYLIVLVWAYLGILIKHVSSEGFANAYPLVTGTVILSLVVLIISEYFIVIKQRQRRNN